MINEAFLKSPVTEKLIQQLGWTFTGAYSGRWQSPSIRSEGPPCRLEWNPPIDSWSINGREQIGPFATMAGVVAVMLALMIPVPELGPDRLATAQIEACEALVGWRNEARDPDAVNRLLAAADALVALGWLDTEQKKAGEP